MSEREAAGVAQHVRVDWEGEGRLRPQTGYLRVSMERMAQLTQRYLEISQAVLTTATSAALRQVDKAA